MDKTDYGLQLEEISRLKAELEKIRKLETRLRLSEERYRRVFERSGAP